MILAAFDDIFSKNFSKNNILRQVLDTEKKEYESLFEIETTTSKHEKWEEEKLIEDPISKRVYERADEK